MSQGRIRGIFRSIGREKHKEWCLWNNNDMILFSKDMSQLPDHKRRSGKMKRYLMIALIVLSLAVLITGTTVALRGKPDFNPHIYADGLAWGTKVTAIPTNIPKGHR